MKSIVLFFAVFFLAQNSFTQVLQWEPSNGSYGGCVTGLFKDQSSNFLIADFQRGGVFRSADDGRTWIATNDGIIDARITSLFYYLDRIQCFTVDGRLYQLNTAAMKWEYLSCISFDSSYRMTSSQGVYYLWNDRAYVYRSFDGVIWEKVNDANGIGSVEELFTEPDGYMLLTTTHGANYITKTKGLSWQPVFSMTGTVNSIVSYDDRRLYAGTKTGLYFSLDSGVSWYKDAGLTPIHEPVSSVCVNNLGDICLLQGEYVCYEASFRHDWKKVQQPSLSRIYINDRENIAGYNKHSGLWHSEYPGGGWVLTNAILHETSITGFFRHLDDSIAVCTPNGVFVSGDSGSTWIVHPAWSTPRQERIVWVSEAEAGIVAAFSNSTDTTLNFQTVRYSSDNGYSWETRFASNQPCTEIAFRKEGTISILSSDSVFVSTDNGYTWYSSVTKPGIQHVCIGAMNRIFAYDSSRAYMSDDMGNAWSVINGVPMDGGQLLCPGGDTLVNPLSQWYSIDNGESWVHRSDMFPNAVEHCSMTYKTAAGELYFAASDGIYFLHDIESPGYRITQDSIRDVRCLLWDGNSTMYIGTLMNGVFRSAGINAGTGVEKSESVEKCTISLYPNPVSGYLELICTVNPRMLPVITIYNNAGMICYRKEVSEYRMGPQSFTIDTRGWLPGLYHLKMESGSFHESKSFIVHR